MKSTRQEIDKQFADLGATGFLESFYPPKRYWTFEHGTQYVSTIFAVHYFNSDAEEIGYWIPDLAEWNGAHVLPIPRLWPEGIENDLKMLVVDVSH